MRFSLKALFSLMTYCCVVIALSRLMSLEFPLHRANFGVLQNVALGQRYNVELVVWLPVAILISYCYFRIVMTPWTPVTSGSLFVARWFSVVKSPHSIG